MISDISELSFTKFICEEKTLDFTRYFFKSQYGRKFVVGDHHQKICEALDKVVKGEIKKLIINIAPRYGKTELAVKNFMAYGLALNPKSRFIHLSYSDDLALDNSEAVKDIIQLDEYRQMFPKVKIKKGSDAKKKWYTSDGGGVYATAAAGQVTGFGAGQVDEEIEDLDDDDFPNESALFSGALIIDDPIKPEDADSEVIRKKVNQRWDSTIKNRVNSRNTPVIVIMQRLHEEDLCGYLIGQSPEEWTVLSFPCLKEDGTALWPFKHSVDELIKMQNENEVVFSRQYQQNPKPLSGYLFNKITTNRFTIKEFEAETTKVENGKPVSQIQSTLGYIDPAEGGGKADFLAAIYGRLINNKVFITDVIYSQDTVEITEPKAAEIFHRLNCDAIKIEKNGNGSGFVRDMRKLIRADKVFTVTNSVNKGIRIWNEYGFIQKYFYFLAEGEYLPGSDYDKFMRNLFSYMKTGENQQDGAPDATAGLSKFIQSNPNTSKLFA